MYLDEKRDLIYQMSWKTKCKRFECRFSDVNVRNPILTKAHVWESYNSNFLIFKLFHPSQISMQLSIWFFIHHVPIEMLLWGSARGQGPIGLIRAIGSIRDRVRFRSIRYRIGYDSLGFDWAFLTW